MGPYAMDEMNKWDYALRQLQETAVENFPGLVIGISALGILSLFGYVLSRIIGFRLQKKWQDALVAHFLGRMVFWLFVSVGIVVALHMAGLGGLAGSIVAGAGISALIIGFAFKDIAENFLAGILLAINRPFKLGDIIETDQCKGPVKKLDLRVTHVRTADGRDIYIPNAMIVKNVLTNYTKDGLIRLSFSVGLDTSDDLRKARDLALEYFAQQQDVLTDPEPDLLVDEIGESSVNVRILFWVNLFKSQSIRQRSGIGETIRSRVMREIKDLFLEHGFNLPSVIVEHKMYRENAPLEVKIDRKNED